MIFCRSGKRLQSMRIRPHIIYNLGTMARCNAIRTGINSPNTITQKIKTSNNIQNINTQWKLIPKQASAFLLDTPLDSLTHSRFARF
jgi:hypothetical protein